MHCRDLVKRYGRRVVLDVDSLAFAPGVTSLLGANGAGKTTLMSIVATVTRPTAGRVTVAGADLGTSDGVQSARRSLGFLPQHFEVLSGSSVADNVAYAAWAHGVAAADVGSCIETVLRDVGLSERRGDRARVLSGGQRQRLGIACAVAHRPAVLLLDEPTVGLDPVQRVGVRRLVTALAASATVVLSTHLVDDAADLSARIVVLRDGRVAFDGPTADLASSGDSGGAGGVRGLEMALMGLME